MEYIPKRAYSKSLQLPSLSFHVQLIPFSECYINFLLYTSSNFNFDLKPLATPSKMCC